MTDLKKQIKAAEKKWLDTWTKGPSRIRWSQLPLQVGDRAPNIRLLDYSKKPVDLKNLWKDGPALLIFLRHYGCSCAHGRAELLVNEYDDYVNLGANVVAIGQGEPERSFTFAQLKNLPCPLLSDPKRDAYQAFNILEGKPSQVAYGLSDEFLKCDYQVAAEVQETRRGGEYAPVDNPYQLPAEFVINQNGLISLAYRSQYCADFANPEVLIAALSEAKMEVN
ncbi:MAG: peroxiredoxin-like family protein [Anaerolineales bacterium]|jgi:peroxiredoxin